MQNLIYKFTVVLAVVLPLVLISRALYIKKNNRTYNWARECMLAVFCAYFVSLLSLVFQPGNMYGSVNHIFQNALTRVQTGRDINLTPFATISLFSKTGLSTSFIINVIANVFMFSPIGFFLPTLWKKWQSAIKVVFAGMLFSVSIETVQLFIGRTTDIDDVILNTAGVAIGYILYKLFAKPLQKLSV